MEDKINEIYEVFKEYFGEDKVDLQDDRTDFDKRVILVWFPEVTVTNEKDESINITDLYARIRLSNPEGLMVGVFECTRGSYLMSQTCSNYLHSHALHIPRENHAYSQMCLGSGPIQRTCSLLAADYDLDRWRLFCYELDKYVTVESETGIPYHHLNQVSNSSMRTEELTLDYRNVPSDHAVAFTEVFKEFIPWFVEQNLLQFSKEGDHWFIAHTFLEYISILTAAFKQYALDNNIDEDLLFGSKVIYRGQLINGKFQIRIPAGSNYNSYNPAGQIACTFKGEDKIITVTNDLVYGDDSKDVIVNPVLANITLYKILSVLNYGTIRKREGSATEEDRILIL